MASSCYAGESACYRAASDIENRIQYHMNSGLSHQEAELRGVEDFAIECSLIKVGASEDMQNCADQGIQILGGMGFSADTPMESAWRDSRIGRIYEGTNEINRMLSIGLLLKKGMKGDLDLMPAVMKATMVMGSEKKLELKNEPLSQENLLIENFKQLFLMIAGNATQKYGTNLEDEQQVLQALADILIEIYFSESAILRTLKNLNKGEKQEIQILLVQNYVFEAQSLITKRAKEVIFHITEGNKTERNQLLDAVNRHAEYIEYPDIFTLKTKIADRFIKENLYFI
jgi:alkylation response protein AidB-like acyl-CoA dehydrogenase